MMSSEEDPEQQQQEKSGKKRVRQRVDAGEPRNSYASIPNFSSRPPPGSCSPLAALYHNGYAASKMLCDLLGSSTRQQQEMIVLEGGVQQHRNNSNGRLFVKGGDFCEGGSSESESSSSSHLLRDILQQGRGGVGEGHAPASPGDCFPDKDEEEAENEMAADAAAMLSSPPSTPSPPPLPPAQDSLESKRARVETIVSNMMPPVAPRSNGTAAVNGEPQPPVNGCKKRKLYQPQQHDKRTHEDEEDFEDDASSAKRRVGSNGSSGLFTFRQQLRHMQQQLVAMQQQYMEMLDGDSSDDEERRRPKSVDSEPSDMKPVSKTEPASFVDYDNASMYDNQPSNRLLIDEAKEKAADRLASAAPVRGADYEWLAESLKAELSTSLSQVVDAVVSRCVQRKAKVTPPDAGQETPGGKDPTTLLSQMLDRKSPRTAKVIDRGTRMNGCGLYPQQEAASKPPFFYPLKPPASVAATAAFLYGSPPAAAYHSPPPASPPDDPPPEQTEAMSLVVPSKKKRHKVTDTRLRPPLCGDALSSPTKYDPLPPLYHPPPPPLVPVSLPTSVAVPNPSLIHQSELFHHGASFDAHPHPYSRLSQHFAAALEQQQPREDEDAPALHHPLHPLLTPFHHRGSPDYSSPHHHLKAADNSTGDMSDAGGDSPANYGDMAMISFMPSSLHTSTLTPMHLRKAKLMFFFARYPSSAVLKMYFPDIRFNKNNTAQLVKWFSNFREFFYIQMEKYARQAITEGIKSAEDLKVNADSELLRVLNLHYNRNNHIPSPEQFRYVVEQTLREFYKALVAGKDSEQSWKKSIYKVIARMDDSVPDYFKSPNFLDTLE